MPSLLPKVQGNVSEAVYEQLLKLQQERGCSLSRAVAIALEGYFELRASSEGEGELKRTIAALGDRLAAVERWEHRIEGLEAREQALRTQEIHQLGQRLTALEGVEESRLYSQSTEVGSLQERMDRLEARLAAVEQADERSSNSLNG